MDDRAPCAQLRSTLAVVMLTLAACGTEPSPPAASRPLTFAEPYGALTPAATTPTGVFTIAELDGTPWLVAPDGGRFLSIGVNAVSPWGYTDPTCSCSRYAEAVARHHGTASAWAAATHARLRSWGFNTLGAWSSFEYFGAPASGTIVDDLDRAPPQGPRLPYTVILYMSGADWEHGTLPDFYAETFTARTYRIADTVVARHAEDPYLIGYFLDNEMRWGVDWRSAHTLFATYMGLPATAPGKRALVAFLRAWFGSRERFARSWCTETPTSWSALLELRELPGCRPEDPEARAARSAFLYETARRYFAQAAVAIRSVDPRHLILGSRVQATITPPEVLAAQAPYVDVVSVNSYELELNLDRRILEIGPSLGYPSGFFDPGADLGKIGAYTGRPVLVSEFGIRAHDSGLPNTKPPGFLTVPNQLVRLEVYRELVLRWAANPWLVGFHWFDWVDEPAGGRFDGENSNWGLVREDDTSYAEFVTGLRAVHEEAWRRRLAPHRVP